MTKITLSLFIGLMQNNAPADRALFTTRTPLNQMEQFGSVGFNDALYLLVVFVNHLIMNGGPFRLCLTAGFCQSTWWKSQLHCHRWCFCHFYCWSPRFTRSPILCCCVSTSLMCKSFLISRLSLKILVTCILVRNLNVYELLVVLEDNTSKLIWQQLNSTTSNLWCFWKLPLLAL